MDAGPRAPTRGYHTERVPMTFTHRGSEPTTLRVVLPESHTSRLGAEMGTVIGMERMVLVTDPDLGTIAAVIDAEGSVVSTGVDELKPVNLQQYQEAADLAARELAALYAEANPGYAKWIAERFWDDCIAEGGAR